MVLGQTLHELSDMIINVWTWLLVQSHSHPAERYILNTLQFGTLGKQGVAWIEEVHLGRFHVGSYDKFSNIVTRLLLCNLLVFCLCRAGRNSWAATESCVCGRVFVCDVFVCVCACGSADVGMYVCVSGHLSASLSLCQHVCQRS